MWLWDDVIQWAFTTSPSRSCHSGANSSSFIMHRPWTDWGGKVFSVHCLFTHNLADRSWLKTGISQADL